VLEEVRDARLALRLVARAYFVEQHRRDDGIAPSLGQEHAHAVSEALLGNGGTRAQRR
jgi:hypothetical protein